MIDDWRTERDALGPIRVPLRAMYGAQTQRAVENTHISPHKFSRFMISTMGIIKAAAATANAKFADLDPERARAINTAAIELQAGEWDDEIIVGIFQTGSGTSLNMNVNEVLARRAQEINPAIKPPLHPNDDVNRSQSSNDVIPTALRIAALLQIKEELMPAMLALDHSLMLASKRMTNEVKLGRTHLMDAMPVSWSQVWKSWRERIDQGRALFDHVSHQLVQLPLGGTAVGTGVNAPPHFADHCIAEMAQLTSLPLHASSVPMSLQAGSEAIQLCGAAMRQMASTLLRLCDDIRWLASGPLAGLSEIVLPERQQGSSIMPDKVNPVIEEAIIQACLQVQAHDYAISQACLFGSFELHTMQPLMAYNLLEGLSLLSSAIVHLAKGSIDVLELNQEHNQAQLRNHPILVTALAPIVGYDVAAKIAKQAKEEVRSVRDVALEYCDIKAEELVNILDPHNLV